MVIRVRNFLLWTVVFGYAAYYLSYSNPAQWLAGLVTNGMLRWTCGIVGTACAIALGVFFVYRLTGLLTGGWLRWTCGIMGLIMVVALGVLVYWSVDLVANSTLRYVCLPVIAIALGTFFYVGARQDWQATRHVVHVLGFAFGAANRRVGLLFAIAIAFALQSCTAPWGESAVAEQLRLMAEEIGEAQARMDTAAGMSRGATFRPVIEAPSSNITKGWWGLRAAEFFIFAILYTLVGLRVNLRMAIENFQRRWTEGRERAREAGRPESGGRTTEGGAIGRHARVGAVIGTVFLILEFLGDMFLHSGRTTGR